MIRSALPAMLLLLGACERFEPLPPPRSASGPDAPLIEACRREAERQVLFQDRGQQMRMDEGANSVGLQASIPSIRAQSDSYGQRIQRDRLAEDCIRRNQGGPAPVDRRPAPARR